MSIAKQIGRAIEFVFKWFGLVLMLAAMIAILATKPPSTVAESAESLPPTSADAR